MTGHFGATTSVFQMQVSAAGVGLLGFFGATPIAQPSSTGNVTGHTAGASTALRIDSTLTGNFGTKAYTVSDVVEHLKKLGILAAS